MALCALLLIMVPASTAHAYQSVSDLQHELNALAARISEVQSEYAVTQVQLQSLRRGVGTASKELIKARVEMRVLAQSLYMDSLSSAATIMNATSVMEFGDRISFADRINSNSQDVLERVAIARIHMERRQREIAAILKQQRDLLATLVAQRLQLNALFNQAQAAIAAFNAAHRFDLHASRSVPLTGTGILKVCPVDQPHAYSDDFGAPRPGGRRHQGNDILAPRGTAIRAPFDGIFKANTSGLGGNQAKVFMSLGHVFNAHLEGYAGIPSGTFVKAGTIIGYVGDTGDARGGPTHDHFEWHPGNGPAVDPYPYLNQVC
ncbi:MAG: murein hydrolase activator EnvC family protein [Actinomycetota bacterium]